MAVTCRVGRLMNTATVPSSMRHCCIGITAAVEEMLGIQQEAAFFRQPLLEPRVL